MKLHVKKSLYLLLLLTAFVAGPASAQDLTGIWRGFFKTDLGVTYKLEIQIKQTSSGFKGVTYSYLTTVFYGKAVLTGSFNKADKSAMIKEIRTVELRMSPGSVSCIMKYLLDYSKSGKEEFLEGVYSSAYENDGYGGKKGDDCGSGIVRLRKVPTSDFYIEPFLRDEPVASRPRNNPPPKVNTSPKQQPSTLVPKQNNNSTARNNKPAQKPPKPNNDNSKTVTSIPVDSASSTAKVPNLTTNKPPRPAMNSTPAVIRNRSGELMRTLTIHNPKVTVKIFDNGEIDDDTVSVYLNGRLMLSSKKLTAAPIILNFLLDDDNPDQELTMVAENLGRIPPNTSLMIVEAGDQRFDVRITSTEQKNAVVRFRYEPKE
jgi:hypothetical protein